MTSVAQTYGDEAGFTLIELLVAIALLALMATYALNALSYVQNFDRVINRIEHQSEVAATARHLEQTLSDARVVFGSDENGGSELDFEGRPDSLEFVGILNRNLVSGGIFRLRYGLQQNGSSAANQGAVFTMWRELFRVRTEAAGKAGEKTPTILMDGVQSLKFQYFGNFDPEKAPTWLDNWPKGETLPKLISIQIGFPPGDVRRWPQLIIPVQASR